MCGNFNFLLHKPDNINTKTFLCIIDSLAQHIKESIQRHDNTLDIIITKTYSLLIKHQVGLLLSDHNHITLSLNVYDITLILQDLDSVENTIKTLKLFHKCYGLQINIEKTKAKYIR